MATGYTHKVEDGSVTSFREFATECARAFGANILMRDVGMDVPIVDYVPSPHHKESLAVAHKELAEAQALSLEQAERLAIEEHKDNERALADQIEGMKVRRARYDRMLAKVKAWIPPTKDHNSMKDFMIEQLETSIKFDCYDPTKYHIINPLTGDQYRTELIESAKNDIEYHEKGWKEEVQRTNERNAWNRTLFESLKEEK